MTTRKKIPTPLLIAFLMITGLAYAQDELKVPPQYDQFSIGIAAGHYRYDPGLGLELTTPAFLQNNLSIRIRASIQWLEAYHAVYYDWAKYRSYSVALVYNADVGKRTRFFAEFGMLGIVPDFELSDEKFLRGFYQLNGLEITLLDKKDYSLALYFGLGPAFIEAYAEKIEGSPRYGNGIHYINGLRFYF